MSVLNRDEIQVIREGKRVFTWGGVLDLMDTIAARDAEIERLRKALEFGTKMVESTLAHVSHGGPSRQDAEEWLKMAHAALTDRSEHK